MMTIETLGPAHHAPIAGGETSAAWPRAAARTGLPIPSEELLRGRASVTIDHEGTHYVLRATRAGKLILTK
jgi:hemin uptake protein HemP